MTTITISPDRFSLTMAEIKEFNALKQRLFGTDTFVVFDEDSDDVRRYDQLLPRILHMKQYAGVVGRGLNAWATNS